MWWESDWREIEATRHATHPRVVHHRGHVCRVAIIGYTSIRVFSTMTVVRRLRRVHRRKREGSARAESSGGGRVGRIAEVGCDMAHLGMKCAMLVRVKAMHTQLIAHTHTHTHTHTHARTHNTHHISQEKQQNHHTLARWIVY